MRRRWHEAAEKGGAADVAVGAAALAGHAAEARGEDVGESLGESGEFYV